MQEVVTRQVDSDRPDDLDLLTGVGGHEDGLVLTSLKDLLQFRRSGGEGHIVVSDGNIFGVGLTLFELILRNNLEVTFLTVVVGTDEGILILEVLRIELVDDELLHEGVEQILLDLHSIAGIGVGFGIVVLTVELEGVLRNVDDDQLAVAVDSGDGGRHSDEGSLEFVLGRDSVGLIPLEVNEVSEEFAILDLDVLDLDVGSLDGLTVLIDIGDGELGRLETLEVVKGDSEVVLESLGVIGIDLHRNLNMGVERIGVVVVDLVVGVGILGILPLDFGGELLADLVVRTESNLLFLEEQLSKVA